MLPEFSLKKITLKVSTDKLSLVVSYCIFLIAIGWYLYAKSWHHGNIIALVITTTLVILQFIFVNLPQTKNKPFFSSGGASPLIIYNLAMAVGLIWYIPLYSPFLLVLPPIFFITVYYRGAIVATLTIAELIIVVIAGTAVQGLPHAPYAYTYPYIIVLLGMCYIVNVSRAGHIENGLRLELSRVAGQTLGDRQRLSTLINSIGDAVLAIDTNGNILFYNATVLDLFNTQAIKIGQPLSAVAKIYDKAGQRIDLLKLASASGGKASFNGFHILPEDDESQKIDLAIDAARIEPSTNNVQASGFIFLIRDITKEKTLDEERDEFISVTSHELRTPITLVEADLSIAMLDQEGVPPLPKVVRERLEKAHEGVVYLANLTNQLITLSEAEKNQLEIISGAVDIKELLAELEDKYKPEAKKKHLRLSIKHSAALPVLNTSKIYLSQILDNLLNNAMKYTEKGSIELAVTATDGGRNVVFAVKDTGIGISISDKPKLFGKFFRSEDFHTRETGGAGLGLYMSSKLASYLNAKLWFDSELGKGSTFYISLPAEPQLHSRAAKKPVTTAP